jgi:hypothetical protein
MSWVIAQANKAVNKKELLQLLTSNLFSILYYNSEVWQRGSLNNSFKKQLMSSSAKTIRLALHYPDPNTSHVDLQRMLKRATLNLMRKYKLSLLLYRTFNKEIPEIEWLSLNFDQTLTSRQTTFNILRSNKLVGMILSN